MTSVGTRSPQGEVVARPTLHCSTRLESWFVVMCEWCCVCVSCARISVWYDGEGEAVDSVYSGTDSCWRDGVGYVEQPSNLFLDNASC